MSLAWLMVRNRFAAFAGTFVAIAAGVAVVTGATSLYLSSRPEAPERYDAAAVLVRSPVVADDEVGRPEYRAWTASEATTLTARLGALPGVTAAAADPAFYVQRVVGGRAQGDPETSRLDGHSWSSSVLGGYRLSAGRAPAAEGEVAVAGSVPGTRLAVLTAAGPADWLVTGTVDGPGLYVADATALRLAGGVRAIGLTVSGDPESVATSARQAIGASGTVLSGAGRDTLEPDAVTGTRWLGAQLLIALVTLGLFVSIFVVASTCALSAAQRTREIGLLRTVGATPGQVQRLLYGETLVVAVLAGLAGVPFGALGAPLLAGPLISAGLEPATFAVTAQPAAWAGAFLLGVVVALAGAIAAARRASRIPPLDALREAAVDLRPMTVARWLTGLVAAVTGIGLLAALPKISSDSQAMSGLGAAMLLLTAAAMLAPVLIVPLVRLVTWPWRRAATGMLVREGTLVAVRRVASTAAPVLLTVGFTVLLTGAVATIDDAAGIELTDDIPAATVAVPDGTPGLSDAAVRTQPGDASVMTRLLITTGSATKGYDAAGLAGGPPTPADGVVLSSDKARELGASAGSALTVRWADGSTARLPVRAVDRDAADGIVVPRELVRQHDPNALTGLVRLRGPAVPAVGAQSMTARDYVRIGIDEEGDLVKLFLAVLIGLGVGYTVLAVGNTLLMATAGRRAEFRALRLAGATTGQVLRVTSAEALLAVAVGTVLGAGVAAATLSGVRAAVEAELHQAVALAIPWSGGAAIAGLCALTAVAATATPILRARR